MSSSYLRNTNGCIAVYDITDRKSFANVESHIREFLNYQNQDVGRINDKYKSPSKKKRSGVLLSDTALKKRSGVSGVRSENGSLDGSDDTPPPM